LPLVSCGRGSENSKNGGLKQRGVPGRAAYAGTSVGSVMEWWRVPGLLWIRDSLGARVSHVETKTPAEFEDNFRQYGTQGYDLVFGHWVRVSGCGSPRRAGIPAHLVHHDIGLDVGREPRGHDVLDSPTPRISPGSSLASATKTKKIGVLGGTALPPVVESFRAFEQGARATDSSVRVVTSYIGNWDDVSAGKEQALAQLAQGVDVIFQNADAAGLGVFQAARERSALVIGSNSNQNGVAPDVTLGSVVIDLPRAFLQIAREVKAKTFQPRVVELGEESHVVTLVLNPALTARIPSNARTRNRLAPVTDARRALQGSRRYIDSEKVTRLAEIAALPR
jgi:hypothetical protein